MSNNSIDEKFNNLHNEVGFNKNLSIKFDFSFINTSKVVEFVMKLRWSESQEGQCPKYLPLLMSFL